MTLPITTRYVRIEAPDTTDGDGFANPTYSIVEASTPGHIGPATQANAGDYYRNTDAVLFVNDTAVVPENGRVTDLGTGDVYSVSWTQMTLGNGLDHRKVGLRRSRGPVR